jgi:hypothetical protein
MKIIKKLKELCPPAYFYFVISMLGFFLLFVQNMGNVGTYSVGIFSTNVTSTISIFLVKFIYILFWTWILDLICKDGYTNISWFLVLIPFIIFFVIIGLLLVEL